MGGRAQASRKRRAWDRLTRDASPSLLPAIDRFLGLRVPKIWMIHWDAVIEKPPRSGGRESLMVAPLLAHERV
jgi:hypothetical protein